jgi:hypothetical protein
LGLFNDADYIDSKSGTGWGKACFEINMEF